MKQANNTLKFKVCLSDGSSLDGTMRCTDEQWNAVFAVLVGKVDPAVVTSAAEAQGESK